MADLVAGSASSSSPPLQVAGGEEERPRRGRRCWTCSAAAGGCGGDMNERSVLMARRGTMWLRGEGRICCREGEDPQGLAGAGARTGVMALVRPRGKMTGRWGKWLETSCFGQGRGPALEFWFCFYGYGEGNQMRSGACVVSWGRNGCGSKNPEALVRVREFWFSLLPGGGGCSLEREGLWSAEFFFRQENGGGGLSFLAEMALRFSLAKFQGGSSDGHRGAAACALCQKERFFLLFFFFFCLPPPPLKFTVE